MTNQLIVSSYAFCTRHFRLSTSAVILATWVSACTIPTHPDSAAPPSEPVNTAAIPLLDNTHWELSSWKSAHVNFQEIMSTHDTGPLTLNLSSASGQRLASGFSGCNQYGGPYSLMNHTLSFGPLLATNLACPPQREQLEQAFLNALAHIDKVGVQMQAPQQLQIFTDNGEQLTFVRRGQSAP